MKSISGKRYFRRMAARMAVLLILAVFLSSGCGVKRYDPLEGQKTQSIVDSCGRTVKVPAQITRIAPSGAVAQMILMTIAPDMLVGLSSTPSRAQRPYFPQEMWRLPTFGQFYGSKASLNLEALIKAQPQIIIDLGDRKISQAGDMDSIQRRTGIPTIFIEADLDDLPAAYRTLGALLGRGEKAERLAGFIENTVEMAQKNAAAIPAEKRKTVYFGTGSTGLASNAAGSSQADVIDIIGAGNAIIPEEVTNKGGGTLVSLEEVYACQPDVIILSAGGPYEGLETGEWSALAAVQNGAYYEIPSVPYDWMSSPPSVNRILGVWWLGNLVYPDLYRYDMTEIARQFYELFWNYSLSKEEAGEFLSHSTLKQQAGF